MESSYNQHLSLFGSREETQPLLSKYKDRMEIFPNFFSNFAGSIHARFASFTSLYPTEDFTTQPERFYAAEIVREKVLQSTSEELPYTTAVVPTMDTMTR